MNNKSRNKSVATAADDAQLYLPAHAGTDQKRHISLQLAALISEHRIRKHAKFEGVCLALQLLVRENPDCVRKSNWRPCTEKVLAN